MQWQILLKMKSYRIYMADLFGHLSGFDFLVKHIE